MNDIQKDPENAHQQAPISSSAGQDSVGRPVIDTSSYVFSRRHNCPVCQKEFFNWALRASRIKLDHSDSDLKPFYVPLDPLYYDVTICQHCGYSAMASYFSKISTLKIDQVTAKISPDFTPKEYPPFYTPDIAIERYKQALLSTLAKDAPDSEKAYLCLKLSWLYREKKDRRQEIVFQRYALAGFKAAYMQESLPVCGMDEPTLTYLLGELNRRLGQLDEALRLISRVLTSPGINSRLRERALEVKGMITDARARQKAHDNAETDIPGKKQ